MNLTRTSRLRFGKHKGKLVQDTPTDYQDWLHEKGMLAAPPEDEEEVLAAAIEADRKATAHDQYYRALYTGLPAKGIPG